MTDVSVIDHERRGFFERRGREGFAKGAKGEPKVRSNFGRFVFGLLNTERGEVTLYARLGIYRPPSYWSTRNRSFDKHPTVQRVLARATGSVGKIYPVTTGSVLPCVQAIERMRIDRFLVLQYEGDSHTLYRPTRNQRQNKPVARHHSCTQAI